ncbi:hypothetical protein DM860_013056 [Cuscuta australis]|uniref:COX assembly mitochondrial protein n=1 Tax=Cuscuta australis TaxID=267555 RepID=A0A328D294_9ASTE|nr:hypothetical protein DM860_013056 [Cuscuta australis]
MEYNFCCTNNNSQNIIALYLLCPMDSGISATKSFPRVYLIYVVFVCIVYFNWGIPLHSVERSLPDPPQSEMPYTSGDPGSPSVTGEGNLNKCSQLYEALTNCHRRIRGGLDREIACRHLNRSLAQCLVAEVCPDESDAVRSLCSSGGTSIKRQQCREAQVEGDFKSFKGKWILEQLGSDHTQLKYIGWSPKCTRMHFYLKQSWKRFSCFSSLPQPKDHYML